MFGISTSWNSHRHRHARSLLDEIKVLNVEYIELNFQLSSEMVDAIYSLVSSQEADLELRSAAAAAYGSLNLPSEKVKTLILDQARS